MARRTDSKERTRTGKAGTAEKAYGRVVGARLEPKGSVLRELMSPSGEIHRVEVPVYPPFRLRTEEEREDSSR